jgi:putative adenylate-forming enzyme
VAVGLSSGTSGHRGLFITTEKERSMWAAAILAKMLPKGHLFGHRIAFFLRADNELYQTINTALIRLEYFDIFKNTDEHIERLNHYQPTIVVAPASMLIELSKRLRAGDLSISPQKIVSVAEILEDSDRIRISSAFKLPIIDQVYQATEGFLACTCSAGHLHLNEDIIFVEKEYMDEHRFYPVITDFKRSSQPVYRYKLNDILVENPEPCSCGYHYTRIDKVEGRSDDIFYFEGQDGGQVTIYPDFIRRCILFVENVGDYQVKQHSEKIVEVCLSQRDEQVEAAITAQFQLLAQQKQFKVPEIHFSDYHWDTSRKLKRIQRL